MRATLVTAILLAAGTGLALAEPPVRLPAGTRTAKDGQVVSSRGLRDTTDAIKKDLDRQGLAVAQIGPYRVRGVELTRFVSLVSTTSWLAIHVVRIDGKTVISFVPRPNP